MIKRMLRYSVLLSSLLLFSCSEKGGEDGRRGYLTINLNDEINSEVVVKSESEEPEEEQMVYTIEVIDSQGNLDVKIDDHREVTSTNPIELLMGKYTVIANNGEPGTGFNLPQWRGQNEVRVWADSDASVDITVKMQKVIFSVSFPTDEAFQEKFPHYSLSVRAGEGDGAETLVFSNEPQAGEGRFTDVAYFVAPANRTLTYTLRMTNADGAQYSSTAEITNVVASEHYHFDFVLGEREDINGAIVLNITLDGEYFDSIVHNLNLNFDKMEMPSYTHNPEFDPEADNIVYPLSNDVTKKMFFSAPRGIRSLILSHMDQNLIMEGLPQVSDFVNISTADNLKLQELGIIGFVSEDGKTGEIDITDFVRDLNISPDDTPYKMSFVVIDNDDRYAKCDFEFTIVSDIQAETMSAFSWSSFALLKGRYFSLVPPAGMTFQYKKVSDNDWTELDASLMNIDSQTMTYSYMLKGLDLNSDYLFRCTSDKDKADGKVAAEVGFVTRGTEGTVYNLSFDDWVKEGKAWYATNDKTNNLVWDSANEGTADIMGQSLVPTTPEETLVIKGKAVRMESGELLGNFAAGNIYTGDFGSATISPVGAKLNWGVPFTSRPLALRGWYRYEPKAINRTSDNYSNLSGQQDFCQIQIFLTNWDKPFEISTGDNRFVDTSENNPSIIAFGGIISQDNTTDNEGNTNGYVKFTIPLVYRNLNQPSYIVISGAASRYGDYFTGGLGSTLYLDELELVYDPTELTEEEFNQVFGRVR